MKVNAGQASSTLIPEYIGSDFDKVVEVADNIEYVKDVAAGIEGLPVHGYIGETPPTQPRAGAEWYCTLDGRTYVWYVDDDSGQWVESSPQSSSIDLPIQVYDKGDVRNFGAVGDGVTDDTDAFQAAINSIRGGVITCAPGKTYRLMRDITIKQKDPGNPTGGFTLDLTGSLLTGDGAIIIDSCKYLKLVNLVCPNKDLVFNGFWYSSISDSHFRTLILSRDAGVNFNSAYWNVFNNCLFQSIKKYMQDKQSGAHNEFTFNQCRLRGNTGQGFDSTADYAIELIGDSNTQSWKFYGGDFSYHTNEIFNIDAANESDVEVTFDNVYFDTKLPQFPHERNRTFINTILCHNAAGVGASTPLKGSFSSVTGQTTNLYQAQKSFNLSGSMPLNLVPGGDLKNDLGTWQGSDGKPIWAKPSGSNITKSDSAGFTGNVLRLEAPLGGAFYFKSSILPTQGRSTGCLIIRSKEPVPREIQVGYNTLYERATISDQYWTVISITDSRVDGIPSDNRGVITLLSPTSAPTAYDVEIAYVGIFMGIDTPLLAASHGFQTIEFYEKNSWDLTGLATAGSQIRKEFDVPGAAFGDFVLFTIENNNSALLRTISGAKVSGDGKVTATIVNPTSSDLTGLPTTGTVCIRVWKRKMFV